MIQMLYIAMLLPIAVLICGCTCSTPDHLVSRTDLFLDAEWHLSVPSDGPAIVSYGSNISDRRKIDLRDSVQSLFRKTIDLYKRSEEGAQMNAAPKSTIVVTVDGERISNTVPRPDAVDVFHDVKQLLPPTDPIRAKLADTLCE